MSFGDPPKFFSWPYCAAPSDHCQYCERLRAELAEAVELLRAYHYWGYCGSAPTKVTVFLAKYKEQSK